MINFQTLLDKYKIKADVNMLLDMWNESHRHYHNLEHLTDLIEQIYESYGSSKIDEKQKELLCLTALFHDIIYDPSKSDNEEKSAEFFLSLCEDKTNKDILSIKDAILDTKEHKSSSTLSEFFNKYDMDVCERDFDELIKWEEGIRSEYVPFYGEEAYKKRRLSFLESLLDKYPQNSENLLKLIETIESEE